MAIMRTQKRTRCSNANGKARSCVRPRMATPWPFQTRTREDHPRAPLATGGRRAAPTFVVTRAG